MSGVRTIKCLFGNEGAQTCNEAFTDFSLHTVTIDGYDLVQQIPHIGTRATSVAMTLSKRYLDASLCLIVLESLALLPKRPTRNYTVYC